MRKSILVTGCNGLVGRQVVKGLLGNGHKITGIGIGNFDGLQADNFKYIAADLTQEPDIFEIFKENNFSHVIHLAAIAHSIKGINISWSRYYRVNTMMSRRIFEFASRDKIPIFFASTVDVYGIQNQEINEETEPNPIGYYAKSKFLAENVLKEVARQPYLIARFAPIYSNGNRRDIHRRYYIRYPKLSYLIGDGMEYEFLHSEKVVNLIVKWLSAPDDICGVINVCDLKRHNTRTMIDTDRNNNLATTVIKIPRRIIGLTRCVADIVFSRKPLLRFSAYKIIHPMRFDRSKLSKFL